MRDVRLKVPGGGATVIPRIPVDTVGVHERAASFTTRSIKKDSKLDALYLAITMMDLTTLEGADTPGKVRQMSRKARTPVPPAQFAELAAGKDLEPIPS